MGPKVDHLQNFGRPEYGLQRREEADLFLTWVSTG